MGEAGVELSAPKADSCQCGKIGCPGGTKTPAELGRGLLNPRARHPLDPRGPQDVADFYEERLSKGRLYAIKRAREEMGEEFAADYERLLPDDKAFEEHYEAFRQRAQELGLHLPPRRNIPTDEELTQVTRFGSDEEFLKALGIESAEQKKEAA
jgi:hypothetical protein